MPKEKAIGQHGYSASCRGRKMQYDRIRLKQIEINAIQKAFIDSFLSTDALWIFGSRVDLKAKGGDIDLYIETGLAADAAVKARLKFVRLICEQIGEQKIDVVLRLLHDELKLDIYEIARKEGVKIV